MTLMLTATGRTVDLMTLAPDDIDVTHVSHCLARINRFGGLTTYSVAAHSVHVADILADAGETNLVQLCGLLHDAHEAYLGDITSPVKQLLSPRFGPEVSSILQGAELRLQKATLQHFGVWTAFSGYYKRIHHADMVALATERRDLLPQSDERWPCLRGIQPHALPLHAHAARTPLDWETTFIHRLEQLQTAVALDMEQHMGGRRRTAPAPAPAPQSGDAA